MQTITIRINNSKALKILKSLEEVNLITLIDGLFKKGSKKQLLTLKPKRTSKSESFTSLSGIWEDRDDITIESLRAKAWPTR